MAFDYTDRSSHVDIVKNPDVSGFLGECQYMVTPTGKELAEIASNFCDIPISERELPTMVIAIDGSNFEASVNPEIPFTRVGFVKLSNVLVDRTRFKSLGTGRFVDPFKVAQLSKDNSTITFTFPSSNISYKGEENVRDGFRRALDEALYKHRVSDADAKTSLRSTLFYLASLRSSEMNSGAINKLLLHKCPNCGAEKIEVLDIPETQKCPHCGKKVYPSDCLRIWEEVSDSASNQMALTRFTNAAVHMLMIHYIRCVKDSFPETYLSVLSNTCFFIDGSLSINGNAAWLKGSIMKCLYELNEELKNRGLPPILVIGLQNHGKLVDYMRLIKDAIRTNSILAVSDEFRNEYVDYDRTPSNTTYGNETYYGQDFLLKTKSGKTFVFDVPYPFPNKDNIGVFKVEKASIANYPNIGDYVRLIEDFESDLSENALVPVALAQKYSTINLQPGGRILDLLAKNIILGN